MKILSNVFLLICLSLTTAVSWAGNKPHFTKIYTMTNSASGNEIIEMTQYPFWGLVESGRTATGGLGTDAGLGNQGALAVDRRAHLLFAVNAGSNSISVFRIHPRGLKLLDTVDSGGERPVSLTLHDNLLYVLNAGSDAIAGFAVRYNGKLESLENSIRPLSGSGTAPAQISFSPWGDYLVVTEKATNSITVFPVTDGMPEAPVVSASVGDTPFGFAFDRRGHLLVSEAAGAAEDASSTSSYDILDDASLAIITAAAPTTETAACWLVVSRNGRFAYVTNARSSSISAYNIGYDGELTLADADGVAATTGTGTNPIDMVLSHSGHYLFALSASTGSIAAFKVFGNGRLAPVTGIENLPTTVNGLAAY